MTIFRKCYYSYLSIFLLPSSAQLEAALSLFLFLTSWAEGSSSNASSSRKLISSGDRSLQHFISGPRVGTYPTEPSAAALLFSTNSLSLSLFCFLSAFAWLYKDILIGSSIHLPFAFLARVSDFNHINSHAV